ncbi:pilus assembly protein TadG-related protein [Catellatospora chokoriensis]|uniref:Putative Flp pilus-assembly TadG-like N-terminal domain-containing protein n=1 Tax=Catellatospora chokoriensis TaxID=310353 RepID=A0A8J3JUF7_9ACTN|nr:pilus assembly protein TadG-related protein [Catellatospora chokoriensis]GIF88694.1 hypothetical protein Cch02nite_21380 [Catellatospora chokoriensis]
MPFLKSRAGADRDRGAAATIVTILLAGGVLLGMTALVVDVGRLYVEREDLQSGADAAAMAVALDCAKRNDPDRDRECRAAAGTAPGYANNNAGDGTSGVRHVCGTDPRLPGCAGGGQGNLTDCLGQPPANATWVEVRTSTRLPSGSFILPPSFAQTLAGGYSGSTVEACARVGWGSPSGGLALTFCLSEWTEGTAGGYAPAPPAVPAASFEVVLKTKDPGNGGGNNGGGNGGGNNGGGNGGGNHGGGGPADPCQAGPSGGDLPGGFGWTDTPDRGLCRTVVTAVGSYTVEPGANVSHACEQALRDARASGQPVSIPIFNQNTGTGNTGSYRIEGFAAFVVTGWGNLPNGLHSADSTLTGRAASTLCDNGEDCIFGYFTNALVPWDGEFGSTPNLGATVIKTIG